MAEDYAGKLVIGIDGFIDIAWEIIQFREGVNDYQFYEKMSGFSGDLAKCEGGGGFLREVVEKRLSLGGFTGNVPSAVLGFGVRPTVIGMLGKDAIDPAYDRIAAASDMISVGAPAIDNIFEFTDGKLMLPHLQDLMSLNWKQITDIVGEARLKEIFSKADIIAMGYWSLIPAYDEIIEGICSLVTEGGREKRLFFDLADIRKNSKEELQSSIKKWSEFNKHIPITLSMNEHETELLFSYYGETFAQEMEGADEKTERVRKATGLDEVVIHTPHFAAAAQETEGRMVLPQNYCESAVITTGAGDHFDGGYIVGLLRKRPMAERIALGNACTDLYVSRGYSPSEADVQEVLARPVKV